jgi:hypothetical protein
MYGEIMAVGVVRTKIYLARMDNYFLNIPVVGISCYFQALKI